MILVACSQSPSSDPDDGFVDVVKQDTAIEPDLDAVADVSRDGASVHSRVISRAAIGNPIHVGTNPVAFSDVTNEVGLTAISTRSVSFVDFDKDGWPDLVAGTDHGVRFFRNMGGTFADISMYSYAGPAQGDHEAHHVLLVDLDNDDDLDVYMTARSQMDQVLMNDGTSRWILPPDGWGVPENKGVQGVHAADVDNDGWLDLYVALGRRVDIPRGESPETDGWNGAANVFLRNTGGEGLVDATVDWNAEAGAFSESFGGVFADFDRDHDLDLFIVRDFLTDHYLRNDGDHFTNQIAKAVGTNDTSLMGVSIGDYNGDAKLDLYATNASRDMLYQGNGDGTFVEKHSDALPVGDASSGQTGWGCALVDLDNDGDQDLVSVSSYEFELGSGEKQSPPRLGYYNVLENNGDGTFSNITAEAGLEGVINGWGLAKADFDRDGDIDIAVGLADPYEIGIGPPLDTVTRGLRILRNDSARGAGNQFLRLELRHPTTNRWAVGAIVDVFAGTLSASRVVTAGESYVSQHSYNVHFGLGSHTVVDRIHVQWPDGTHTVAHSVPAGAWRFFPADGHCCHPGQNCETPWPDCTIEPEHDPIDG